MLEIIMSLIHLYQQNTYSWICRLIIHFLILNRGICLVFDAVIINLVTFHRHTRHTHEIFNIFILLVHIESFLQYTPGDDGIFNLVSFLSLSCLFLH